MSGIYHELLYRYDTKVYQCRSGACSWNATEEELDKAGYHANKDHVHFVQEKDFEKDKQCSTTQT